MILTQKIYIKRINEEMAVYRKNVGIYSTLSSFEMKKKILMYQSSVLSYLNDPVLKEKLLKKNYNVIGNLKLSQNVNFKSIHHNYKNISWKSLLKIVILKFKQSFAKQRKT